METKRIRKILILLILFVLNSFAILMANDKNIIQDSIKDNVSLIKKLSNEQDLIANMIELYIELYGEKPTSINQLKNKKLLDNSFNTSYFDDFNINVSNNSILINSTFNNALVYQKDFYLNDFTRNRIIETSINADIFSTRYYLSKEALNTLSYVGVVDYISPTTPNGATTPPLSDNRSWYNTRTKKILYYIAGSWVSLEAKKLYIVKSLAELNSLNAIENDAGIILTTTSLEKYLFVGSRWVKLENVPYNYNTGF